MVKRPVLSEKSEIVVMSGFSGIGISCRFLTIEAFRKGTGIDDLFRQCGYDQDSA